MNRLFPELLRAATLSVRQCLLSADEQVIVYSDTESSTAIVEAWFAACAVINQQTSLIRVSPRFPETDPPSAAVTAMTQADLVFDIASNTWCYAPSLPRILDAGTRVLQILLPE